MKRIIVKNLSKKFGIGTKKRQGALERFISTVSGKEPKKTIWALKDVSFTTGVGEIVGISGPNGSGKTTLLRTIAGIYKPDKGEVITNGKIVSLIGLSIGLQERLTLQDNIYLCCSLFGLSQKEIRKKYNQVVEFTELSKYENTKIYQFSQGMRQRLAFSIAIHSSPEILLLDEVFEVGDEEYRKKSSVEIGRLTKNGTTVIISSHETPIIEKYCNEAMWIERGKIVRKGEPKKIASEYLQSINAN